MVRKTLLDDISLTPQITIQTRSSLSERWLSYHGHVGVLSTEPILSLHHVL